MRTSPILLLFIAALLIGACNADDILPAHSGVLSVRLTDAWHDYHALRITFAELSVYNGERWLTVNNTPVTVNVLEWSNGRSIEIGRCELEAGTYSQLRMFITKTVIEFGTTSREATWAGSDNAGLKLQCNVVIEAGNIHELILDLDAERSVLANGPTDEPTGFILKPVIRVIEKEMSGSVSGKIVALSSPARVRLFQNGEPVTGTRVDEQSSEFLLAYLAPGVYDLAVTDTEGKSFFANDIQVEANKKTTLGLIRLE